MSSGFGGLGFSMLASGNPSSRVPTQQKLSDFSGRKNPQLVFLVADLRHVKDPFK
jgi:hypothetical protein